METTTFEKAFERLEEILHKMNEGKASLDDSIKLYVEADQLIKTCSERLTQAEQKIEKLVKDRQDNLQLDQNQEPQKEPFNNDEVPF